jgi:hypothetical protein
MRNLVIAAALVLFSCKANNADPRSDREAAIEAARSSGYLSLASTEDVSAGFDTANVVGPLDGGDRKQIRTAHVSLMVTAYDVARVRLDAIVAGLDGSIESTHVLSQPESSEAQIVVRLPPAAIGTLIGELRQLGQVTAETTETKDVTDDYDDTTAKLVAARVLEKRLLQLAASPNGKIDDVLAVEKELSAVRGEIEGDEQKVKRWNSQIALTTFTVEMSTKHVEVVVAPVDHSLGTRIGDDFHASIAALRDAGAWLVSNAIALSPWLVIALPLLLLLRRLARRIKLPRAFARSRPNVQKDGERAVVDTANTHGLVAEQVVKAEPRPEIEVPG